MGYILPWILRFHSSVYDQLDILSREKKGQEKASFLTYVKVFSDVLLYFGA